MMPNQERQGLDKWLGADVVSQDNQSIGKVERYLMDRLSEVPTWIVVDAGILGLTRRIVPVGGASFEDGRVVVAAQQYVVESQPDAHIDGDVLEADAETALSAHYGLGAQD
jgi:hypothetical protein